MGGLYVIAGDIDLVRNALVALGLSSCVLIKASCTGADNGFIEEIREVLSDAPTRNPVLDVL